MSVSIEIKGINKLMAKLSRAAAIDVLEPPMQRAVFRVQARMADYPPQRPGSSYIRGYGFKGGPRTSERLGQRWTTRVIREANGLTGKVGNSASYGPLVQSKKFQAKIHRGRWQTDEQVLNEELPAIRRDFEQAVDEALKGR